MLFPYYKYGKLVKTSDGVYLNGTHIQKAIREQYGCTTAPGMLLEDRGGQTVLGSHWSFKVAYN